MVDVIYVKTITVVCEKCYAEVEEVFRWKDKPNKKYWIKELKKRLKEHWCECECECESD